MVKRHRRRFEHMRGEDKAFIIVMMLVAGLALLTLGLVLL